jgi:hypothetical protein
MELIFERMYAPLQSIHHVDTSSKDTHGAIRDDLCSRMLLSNQPEGRALP